MNCLEFRRAFGADPQHASSEAREHRKQCPACDKYAAEMLRLDGLIKRALDMPVRPASKSAPLQARSRWQGRWYAMAASVLLAIGVGGAFWFLGFPREALAGDVVAHMGHEPEAMQRSDARIATQQLDRVLGARGLHLTQTMGDVSYARNCLIRGHFVPHLVVQTESGPVAVILLPDEKITRVEHFDEQEYHGMLLPAERGAMAVIALDKALVQQVVAKVQTAIAWH
ncbi:MAG TPA: DUF3379 family protein [Steroidobacteraceae bacterium]|nr:DUF3379 family protein [Steroidobacteraceae bacterium]